MTTTARRRADCMIEAYQMARSGEYPDYHGIEAMLLDRYPEAHAWFALETVRMALRNACEEALMEFQQTHDARIEKKISVQERRDEAYERVE